MSQKDSPYDLPPELTRARMAAWASLVDMGIEGMMALQRKLHPDRDPRLYVRKATRRQSEDSHQANVRMLERMTRRGQ